MPVLQAPEWTRLDASITAPAFRCDLQEDYLQDECLLYDLRTGVMHRMNETALFVRRYCDGRTTTSQIAELMTQRYEVRYELALDHIEQLLVAFARAGLLAGEPAE